MRKIERRAGFCLMLALALLLGLALFTARFVAHGGQWYASSVNMGRHALGRVLDRDGDVLSAVDGNGKRTYFQNATVRKATLHAVGDDSGKIGTGALLAFADKLSGYNLITGAYTPLGAGNDLYLTLDARLNYEAYQALNGRKGAVGVYNYQTGEILCMVSTPSFDPENPPDIQEGDNRYDGVYVNRFLSGSFVPGSVFKTVTLNAAIETLPDLFERTFICTGSTEVGGEAITCPRAHGELDVYSALSQSCNGVFAQLAAEIGADTLQTYTEKAGLTTSYQVNGLRTARGRFQFEETTEGQLGWAGVGQYQDMVNPCALMVYMGAIGNGGKAAVPQIISKIVTPLNLPVSFYLKHQTGRLISSDTATVLADMMARNVTDQYGTGRFPNMDICAKSGTAEVGGDQAPNAWFAGFLRNDDAPYAFVVVVENGGSGANVAGNIAATVLDPLVNGY